ncbi:hypothetical protein A6E13_16470 [Aliivibrio fischeri]|uniref:hypothetical protein n=1 Tax=Aliivibrio fischeri TaxID=668 RepID=UPI00080EB91D|nr:hypothetical protein [Aliivibrio fischeri]OCH31816.1 hypothetical protein A6E13_16470 [Aliivibrio fischeri]
MSTKFLVTSEKEAEDHLKAHFKKSPLAAGRDVKTGARFWYCGSKRCVMMPTRTATSNGTRQYLVTVE